MKLKQNLINLGIIGTTTILLSHPALAGQADLSGDLSNNLEAFIKKTGKIVALTSFGVGTILSAIKFNPLIFGSSIGVSLASLYGTPVITGLFSAII